MIAGDARHDSMGHSAKYGVYTILCCTVPMIIHFALVQVCKIILDLWPIFIKHNIILCKMFIIEK